MEQKAIEVAIYALVRASSPFISRRNGTIKPKRAILEYFLQRLGVLTIKFNTGFKTLLQHRRASPHFCILQKMQNDAACYSDFVRAALSYVQNASLKGSAPLCCTVFERPDQSPEEIWRQSERVLYEDILAAKLHVQYTVRVLQFPNRYLSEGR